MVKSIDEIITTKVCPICQCYKKGCAWTIKFCPFKEILAEFKQSLGELMLECVPDKREESTVNLFWNLCVVETEANIRKVTGEK